MKYLRNINEEIGNIDFLKNANDIKLEFDSLSPEEQWKWLTIKGQMYSRRFSIGLDNDNTSIYFEDDDVIMYFKSYIGNASGVEYLLKALGFNAEGV